MTLFGIDRDPITFRAGFIEADLDAVVRTFVLWRQALRREVICQAVSGPLVEQLRPPDPLSSPPRRWLFSATNSPWTLYLDNGTNGSDPATPVSQLSKRLACRGVVAKAVPHTRKAHTGRPGVYGATAFELYEPTANSPLCSIRSVGTFADDDGWEFYASGTVQSFESPAVYEAGRPEDRFTPHILTVYLRSLGIAVSDPSFIGTTGQVVPDVSPEWFGGPPVTLATARMRLGLTPLSQDLR